MKTSTRYISQVHKNLLHVVCGEILTEGKKLFTLPNADVPTKNGAVNVTALAPAPDAITDSVLFLIHNCIS